MSAPRGSTAVMARRVEPPDSLDDFPTQPWACRALHFYVQPISGLKVWEPTCNRGYMARAFEDCGAEVTASDVFDYGYGEQFDFLSLGDLKGPPPLVPKPDVLAFNPPFNRAMEFIQLALLFSSTVAAFARLQLIEGVDRHARLWGTDRIGWSMHPFVERVPLVKGRVDPKASTATAYSWFRFWREPMEKHPSLIGCGDVRLIPPCRKDLERSSDYPEIEEDSPPILNWIKQAEAQEK